LHNVKCERGGDKKWFGPPWCEVRLRWFSHPVTQEQKKRVLCTKRSSLKEESQPKD